MNDPLEISRYVHAFSCHILGDQHRHENISPYEQLSSGTISITFLPFSFHLTSKAHYASCIFMSVTKHMQASISLHAGLNLWRGAEAQGMPLNCSSSSGPTERDSR